MKNICLGTSLWGWSVEESCAFDLLDIFYSNGGRHIDTANSYPINNKNVNYLESPKIISKWCKKNNVKDIKIIYKIGGVKNNFTSESDLSIANVMTQCKQALKFYGSNLHCIMIHWDNREEMESISDTINFIHETFNYIPIGLSGIKNPDAYYDCIEALNVDISYIEVKHNFLYSELSKYKKFAENGSRIWAYGITCGGLKINQEEYHKKSNVKIARSENYHRNILKEETKKTIEYIIANTAQINNIYHIGLTYSEQEPGLFGYIIAPSNVEQLKDILTFRKEVDITKIDLTKLHLHKNYV